MLEICRSAQRKIELRPFFNGGAVQVQRCGARARAKRQQGSKAGARAAARQQGKAGNNNNGGSLPQGFSRVAVQAAARYVLFKNHDFLYISPHNARPRFWAGPGTHAVINGDAMPHGGFRQQQGRVVQVNLVAVASGHGPAFGQRVSAVVVKRNP